MKEGRKDTSASLGAHEEGRTPWLRSVGEGWVEDLFIFILVKFFDSMPKLDGTGNEKQP
jgi:hypothetical protein